MLTHGKWILQKLCGGMNMKYRNNHTFLKSTSALLVLSMTATILTGCQQTQPAEEEVAIAVEVIQPQTDTIIIENQFIGTVEPANEVIVIPKIAGEVTETFFQVGDKVEEGALLFTIDDTAANITLASASAAFESAQAGLITAQAALKAQEANHISVEAGAAETIGKMDTTQMELNSAVEKAQNAVGASRGSAELSKQSFASAQSMAENIDANLDILKTNQSNAESYYNSLSTLKATYQSIASSTATDLEQLAIQYGVTGFDAATDTTAEKVALKFLDQKSSYNTITELDAAVATAKSTITSIESSVNSAEGSYDSYITAQVQAAIGMSTSAENVETAEKAKSLAEQYKLDYENYTKTKILAGVNASLAGADASLTSAQSSITTASSSVKSAKANLDSANIQLEHTRVEAPVSGMITAIHVSEHNFASNSTQAYVIESTDGEKVVFYVAEKSIQSIMLGNEVTIEKDNLSYQGKITFVGTSVDPGTGLFKVEAMIGGENQNLVSGTNVIIRTITSKAADVMTIPIDTVYYESEKSYVFLSVDGTAKKVEIATGLSNDSVIEVVSGIEQNSEVISNWNSQLKDGVMIKAAEEVEGHE